MARRQEKRVRKLKKNHSWISLIIFIIIFATAGLIMWEFLKAFINYMVDSKLSSEYAAINYMAKLYEMGIDSEESGSIYELLGAEGREYIIKDANGNILYDNGENTCIEEGGEVYLSSAVWGEDGEDDDKAYISKDKIYIYKDSRNGYIYANRYNAVKVDFIGLFTQLRNSKKLNSEFYQMVENSEEQVTVSDSEGILLLSTDDISLAVPVWMEVDVDNYTFIGKAFLHINIDDMVLFAVFAALLMVIAFLMFVVMLVSVINGILSQRRMLRLFFTDIVTRGHNWMWFVYRGEHFLRKRSSAKNTYAPSEERNAGPRFQL